MGTDITGCGLAQTHFPGLLQQLHKCQCSPLYTAGRAGPASKSSSNNCTQHPITQIPHTPNPFPSSPITSHSLQSSLAPKALSPTPNTDVQPTSVTNPCHATHCLSTGVMLFVVGTSTDCHKPLGRKILATVPPRVTPVTIHPARPPVCRQQQGQPSALERPHESEQKWCLRGIGMQEANTEALGFSLRA